MTGGRGMATLIVNPAAGRAALLEQQLPAITSLLERNGFAARVVRTTAEAGSGAALARAAVADSALILACGGDGTVHDMVAGLAGRALVPLGVVPLGVLPLGTANALARNLSLPQEPLAAAARLLAYHTRPVPLGRLETASGTRWFTVMAGCGPDGALAARLPPALKARLGRAAYYAYAARLFVSNRWPAFRVRYRLNGQAGWHETEAIALLAARVPDLGGIFGGLARHVPLLGPSLAVDLLRPPARTALTAWFAASQLGTPNPWLTRVQVDELVCEGPAEVLCQADAEPAGRLPMRMTVVPDALQLLMP